MIAVSTNTPKVNDESSYNREVNRSKGRHLDIATNMWNNITELLLPQYFELMNWHSFNFLCFRVGVYLREFFWESLHN